MKYLKRTLLVLRWMAVLACLLTGCALLDTGGMGEAWSMGGTTEVTENQTEETYGVPDSCYEFYDYKSGEYAASDVGTYQAVTGAVCEISALDWGFLDEGYEYMVEGYDESYGLYFYAYTPEQFELYTRYLSTVGFEFEKLEKYGEGVSYFYCSQKTGYRIDLFLVKGNEYLVIEPYFNAE